jgi:hypothetical protein
VDCFNWKRKPYFPKFFELPPEIRAAIIHEYLQAEAEAEAGRLSKHCHYDAFGSRCCVWEYPNVLISCDNQRVPRPSLPQRLRALPKVGSQLLHL